MPDFILVDGDEVAFVMAFGDAVVSVRPGTISGSGPGTVGDKKICVDGDESSVEVAGCAYLTPQYPIPGTGTLKVARLTDQKAQKTKTGGKAVLLKGGVFDAKFEVQSPAQKPNPPSPSTLPDAKKSYDGKARFIPSNSKVKGA